jgi:hypothetical protein
VLWSRHSAKILAKGPTGGLFAECQSTRHSAKKPPLSSAYESSRYRDWRWGPLDPSLPRAVRADTRQNWPLCRVPKKTLGKGSVTVTWRCDSDFSLPSVKWHSANSLPSVKCKFFVECPTKSTRQRGRCRCTVRRAFFAECYTRQSLCRV